MRAFEVEFRFDSRQQLSPEFCDTKATVSTPNCCLMKLSSVHNSDRNTSYHFDGLLSELGLCHRGILVFGCQALPAQDLQECWNVFGGPLGPRASAKQQAVSATVEFGGQQQACDRRLQVFLLVLIAVERLSQLHWNILCRKEREKRTCSEWKECILPSICCTQFFKTVCGTICNIKPVKLDHRSADWSVQHSHVLKYFITNVVTVISQRTTCLYLQFTCQRLYLQEEDWHLNLLNKIKQYE